MVFNAELLWVQLNCGNSLSSNSLGCFIARLVLNLSPFMMCDRIQSVVLTSKIIVVACGDSTPTCQI